MGTGRRPWAGSLCSSRVERERRLPQDDVTTGRGLPSAIQVWSPERCRRAQMPEAGPDPVTAGARAGIGEQGPGRLPPCSADRMRGTLGCISDTAFRPAGRSVYTREEREGSGVQTPLAVVPRQGSTHVAHEPEAALRPGPACPQGRRMQRLRQVLRDHVSVSIPH